MKGHDSLPEFREILCCFALSALLSFNAFCESPIADAAERGEHTKIRALLEPGAAVDARQPDGMTALLWAAWRDDLEAARLLLASGADVRATNHYGVAPLFLACENGDASMVRLFLEAGADVNATLRGKETPLMVAARTGTPDSVRALIAHGAEVNAKERSGQTALMWAAAEGHAEVVKILMEAGADFRTPLDSGFTPLFFAVREGKISVVRTLLDAGLDINAPFEHSGPGKGPADGMSPLLLAVENGHFELAVALLEAGADPNDQRSGYTPLHTLTWVRKPDRGDNGDPAPTGSGALSSLDLVQVLVAHGAEVNAQLTKGGTGGPKLGMKGATPLLMASKTADVPYMRLLLALGADPFLANADGSTPLMAAAGLGTHAPTEEAGSEPEAIEAVKLLLSLGADVNTVDNNGETAMHGAAYKSLPRVAALLDQSGADIALWNRKNKHGWTPLLIARGYRPGNFKPAPETIDAIIAIMHAQGVAPPDEKPVLQNPYKK